MLPSQNDVVHVKNWNLAKPPFSWFVFLHALSGENDAILPGQCAELMAGKRMGLIL
jgi:hypothetical protein